MPVKRIVETVNRAETVLIDAEGKKSRPAAKKKTAAAKPKTPGKK